MPGRQVGLKGSPEFRLTTMQRIIKNAAREREGNNNIRIAENTTKVFSLVLEDAVLNISKMALSFANHAKRNTIKVEDIRLAKKYSVN